MLSEGAARDYFLKRVLVRLLLRLTGLEPKGELFSLLSLTFMSEI